MSQDKAKTLKITTDQIEQKFGKGAIMKLGENTNMQVGVIPTGALPLDIALGIGGVPRFPKSCIVLTCAYGGCQENH